MSLFCRARGLTAAIMGLVAPLLLGLASAAEATPALTIDMTTGQVLYAHEAARPWYPASLTKLMTVYVALKAVREHRIALDTPLVVSARAAAMPPSKMGFAPGSEVTLDNALKMLMVKSANDLAIVVAEGVAGSVPAFAEEMNEAAASLGMRQSHFVNPNGLHDPQHYSSARDLAVLARALYATFPDHADLFSIGALSFDGEIIPNHNNLMGRYPGIDGMKTGFTCPAGFNVVATSTRDGRRLAVIVMGGPSVALRTTRAATLLDRGFLGVDRPLGSLGEIADSTASAPPDPRNNVCRNRAKSVAAYNAETDQLMQPLKALENAPQTAAAAPARSLFDPTPMSRPLPVATRIAMVPTPVFDPIPVYVGPAPGYAGPVAQARPPHSPVGTEPVPDAATAYADRPDAIATATPLKPDVNALPLKGRGVAKTAKAKPVKVAARPPEAKAAPKKVAARTKPAAPVVAASAGGKGSKTKTLHTAQRKPKDKATDHGE